MKSTITALVLTFLFTACAASPPQKKPTMRWSRPSTTQEQYMSDRYACFQESAEQVSGAAVTAYGGTGGSHTAHSHNAYMACMGARGYVVDPNGPLVAPPGMEIHFDAR